MHREVSEHQVEKSKGGLPPWIFPLFGAEEVGGRRGGREPAPSPSERRLGPPLSPPHNRLSFSYEPLGPFPRIASRNLCGEPWTACSVCCTNLFPSGRHHRRHPYSPPPAAAGGHVVSGHIDGTTTVVATDRRADQSLDVWLDLRPFPPQPPHRKTPEQVGGRGPQGRVRTGLTHSDSEGTPKSPIFTKNPTCGSGSGFFLRSDPPPGLNKKPAPDRTQRDSIP